MSLLTSHPFFDGLQNLLALLAVILTLKVTLFHSNWRAALTIAWLTIAWVLLDVLATISGLPLVLLLLGAVQTLMPPVVLILLGKDLSDGQTTGLSRGKFSACSNASR